ncbi:conjugative plasmid protein (pARN3) [Stygiolobus caldivivus]|uniref:Conjugative plasmid protein (PARN3) n=1 Tax=Stygiolobus caldivivus TaxID=2824673 RepID=A0A8D5U715_9CREN|nr:conjugative plasmid protein (pARN3) [Stygiolobus caldivivus]BCU70011.1 conjugative plasmid protein (pARN3) [Stygiolobus caldivivus]
MRGFSRNELVILNPMQRKSDLITARVFTPLYAAADDGIYVVNRKGLLTRYGPKAILTYLVGGFGALILFSGLMTALNPYTSMTGLTSEDGLLAAVIGGLMVYFARRYARKLDVKLDAEKGVEGRLVVPWSAVKTISVMNVRQEIVTNRPGAYWPVYKEIGDWHVLTTYGGEIVIPGVDDPFNKLNYVKSRFNLSF